MSIKAVILDSTPLGLLTQRSGESKMADSCRLWVEGLLNSRVNAYIPEICDYEIRRELLLRNSSDGVKRLEGLEDALSYLPITTALIRQVAKLWADVRRQGRPTADPHVLDGDVIVAAHALSLGLPTTDFIVATSNVNHLSLFVPFAL